jgi:hypothetical protein
MFSLGVYLSFHPKKALEIIFYILFFLFFGYIMFVDQKVDIKLLEKI